VTQEREDSCGGRGRWGRKKKGWPTASLGGKKALDDDFERGGAGDNEGPVRREKRLLPGTGEKISPCREGGETSDEMDLGGYGQGLGNGERKKQKKKPWSWGCLKEKGLGG